MSDSLQVWVRNDKGQVYGPLSPPSVELLIDNGVIGGRLQVSTDGQNYVFPGRVPGLRMIFPREVWGETVVPGDDLDAEWGRVAMPAALPGGPSAPLSSPSGVTAGAPVAGPGARAPMPGPGARAPAGGPVAGPGARSQQQQQRAFNPSQFGAQGRPPAPVPGAPVKSSPSVADFLSAPMGAAAPPPHIAPRPVAPAPARPVVPVDDISEAPSPPVAPPRPAAQPPPTPKGDAALPASGSLEQHGAPRLYYLAASGELTGRLTVTTYDRELLVHFKRGNPEFLDSSHPDDSLATFLTQQRLASPEQIAQAQREAPRFGGDLLGALFGLGLVNPNAVFTQLGQRATALLMRLLINEQGSFTFVAEELPAARSMPLGNRWALYADALRKLPQPELRRRLARAWDLPVMKAGGRVQLADVRLTPQETRALNYFDGVRSLAQLARDVPAEAEVILRTAFMLHPLELVSFADVPVSASPGRPPSPPRGVPPVAPPARPVVPAPPPAGAAPPRPVVAPPPVAPAPAKPASPYPGGAPPTIAAPPPGAKPPGGAPPTVRPPPVTSSVSAVASSPSTVARAAPAVMRPVVSSPSTVRSSPSGLASAPVPEDLKGLTALFETMKKQTYFEVLGLKKDADANQVKVAYLKAARSFHPDTVPQNAPPEVAKVRADIFALISEANRTLSDPVLREDYTAELAAGGSGSKVDIEKILRAEDCFQKGTIMVKARKYPEALKMLESAIADNPDEGEFYAWRGYAKFLLATDRKAATPDVLRDINLCVSKNPNVANAYYFLGFVAKLNGDHKTALANFKKCVALDPKHIDASRELRTMK